MSTQIKMIESDGIYENNVNFQALLFHDNNIGFIAGSADSITHNENASSDTFAFLTKKAKIYKTVDGGRSWIGKDFGEGFFQNLKTIGNSLYAFKISKQDHHTEVYSTLDLGNNWKLSINFPNVVSDLLIFNDTLVIVAKDTYSIFHFYLSSDKGASWVKRETHFLPIFDISNVNKRIFYLSSNLHDEFRKNILVSFSLQNNLTESFEIPKGFDCYFLNNYNGKLKVIGKEGQHLSVYKFEKDKFEFEYSTTDNDIGIFPLAFYSTDTTEVIIGGIRHTNDIEHLILKSSDKGKTWERVDFKIDNLISPFYFKNNKGWFYSGLGKFQIFD